MTKTYDVELEVTASAMLSFDAEDEAEARELAQDEGVSTFDIDEIEMWEVRSVREWQPLRAQTPQMAQASEQDETIAAPLEDDVQEVGGADE